MRSMDEGVNDMRLIDADALKAEFVRLGLGEHSLIERVFADGVYAVIENAPTIDAVPVAQLREMLSNLERMCRGGDEGETYTTGYRNGHHNGQIELLRYILQVPDGTSEGERKDGEG